MKPRPKYYDPTLIPPDLKRCQSEQRSFMTLGPGMIRCANKPMFIAEEVKPGKDGKRGSMSLCEECAQVLEQRCPGMAHFVEIDDSSEFQIVASDLYDDEQGEQQ